MSANTVRNIDEGTVCNSDVFRSGPVLWVTGGFTDGLHSISVNALILIGVSKVLIDIIVNEIFVGHVLNVDITRSADVDKVVRGMQECSVAYGDVISMCQAEYSRSIVTADIAVLGAAFDNHMLDLVIASDVTFRIIDPVSVTGIVVLMDMECAKESSMIEAFISLDCGIFIQRQACIGI